MISLYSNNERSLEITLTVPLIKMISLTNGNFLIDWKIPFKGVTGNIW